MQRTRGSVAVIAAALPPLQNQLLLVFLHHHSRCFRGDYAAARLVAQSGRCAGHHRPEHPPPEKSHHNALCRRWRPGLCAILRHGSIDTSQPPGHGRTPHNQRRAAHQAPTATRLIAATRSPRFKNAQAGSRYVGHHGAQAARPHRRTRPTTPKTGRAPLKKKNPADMQAGKQSPSVGDYGNSFESAWRP